nr:hypothetical protein [Tanacetum cinerariifolium]
MDQDSTHMVAASKVPMLKSEVVEGVMKEKPITTAKKGLEKIRGETLEQYENFTAPSSEMLDQTFDRLQKLVSQLELLEEKLSQKDLNQKLLRSLSLEWNTHDVVWRNKADLDTISIDDLYNNLKVYEPKVKGMSSLSSINTGHEVSTASTQVNATYSINIDNLSDDVICSFFVSQPNIPQLVYKDLEQIYPDDMKEMDLRWQMSMLTMRARRFLKKIGRKLSINGNDIIGFDKSNVECYNFHRRGHFARECRALKNQDNKHKESSRMSVPVETSTTTSLVSCDGLGRYDWSCQAKEGPNYALIAFAPSSSNSESSKEEPKVVRKNDDALIIEEWVSDNEKEDVSQPKIEKKTVRPSIVKTEFVKSKQQTTPNHQHQVTAIPLPPIHHPHHHQIHHPTIVTATLISINITSPTVVHHDPSLKPSRHHPPPRNTRHHPTTAAPHPSSQPPSPATT